MKNSLLLALGLIALASPRLAAEVEPYPGTSRDAPSAAYRVEADGRPVFTLRFRDVSYAWFGFRGKVTVAVKASAPIRTFNLSPHAAGIAAKPDGDTLRFELDRPRRLVVTVNGGERLFIFADPIDPDAPVPGRPGVRSLLEFGADPAGKTLDTARLQRAIDTVAAAHGVLYVPAGIYLTGTLELKSNLTLYLAPGAVLQGSENPADYPADPGTDEANIIQNTEHPEVVEATQRIDAAYCRFILVDRASHVRVAGRGVIDGRGKIIHHFKAINLVMIRRSSDVSFEGILLRDSPLYNCHVVGSDHVTFEDVKLVSDQTVPNTDGIDPDSSRDVLVENSFFCTTDDGISPKASGQSGVRGDLERVTIRHCVFLNRTGAIKMGNETIGGNQRDVTFEDNDLVDGNRAITLSCLDGHVYENLRFIDNRVEHLSAVRRQSPVYIHIRQRSPKTPPATIRNVLIRNLSLEEDYPYPSRIVGLSATNEISGIHFENFTIAGRVCLDAKAARVEIGRFVHDVTFSGPTPAGGKP